MGKTNYAVYSALPPSCRVLDERSPIALLKAVRNDREIAGIHAAMQRDGVALVKFLKWLEEAVPAGNETEISVDKKLHEFRAAQPLYMGESFDLSLIHINSSLVQKIVKKRICQQHIATYLKSCNECMKKNSIIQRNLRIINLLLAEVVERKQHVLS